MKKKYRAIICVIVLIIVTLFICYKDLLIPFIFSSEKIGLYELEIMNKTKVRSAGTNIMNVHVNAKEKDNEIPIPLPEGVAEFSNSIYPSSFQYLVSNNKFVDYIENILPREGFEINQMGALYIITHPNDKNIRLEFTQAMYSKYFRRIEIIRYSEEIGQQSFR